MRTPEDLYELLDGGPATSNPVLVHSMTGFLDAGAAGRLAVQHVLDTLEHRQVVSFDIDDIYDYRARRPAMTFLSDHYGSVSMPNLQIDEVIDAAGQGFLLLHGQEPDHAWQRMAAAVTGLVRRLDVGLVIGMHAVPWPAPHTRPIGVTWHGTDPSLLRGRTSFVGELEVPGHLAGLIELRLGEASHPAMGFAAHVPHYLVQNELPRAAVALLEHLTKVTGLDLPLGQLAKAADASDVEIANQIAGNPENEEAIKALEAQYDAVIGTIGASAEDGGHLPSGEEIAAQVEQFLSDMDRGGREDT